MPVIALDLGGTKLAAALVDEDGNLLFTETRALEQRKGLGGRTSLFPDRQTCL